MNNTFTYITVISFILFFISVPRCQNRVEGYPIQFKAPLDFFNTDENYTQFLRTGTSPKDKSRGWQVFSDRDDNPLYNKPDGSKNGKILEFRDGPFYVIDEVPDWVKLIKARVGDNRKIIKIESELGWIEKKKLLLWTNSLVDINTRINKKVLILQSAEEAARIYRGEKEKVAIYNSPVGMQSSGSQNIMNFFFVYKKENGRLLIGSEYSIPYLYDIKKLIGWVDARDCTPWDTRVCLEPNFEISAFYERKDNENFQVKGFSTMPAARKYMINGDQTGEVYWDQDPVKLDKKSMSKTDPYRFNGTIVRFPMVSMDKFNDLACYQSGVVGNIKLASKGELKGEIPESVWSMLKDRRDVLESKANNVNIFFLIEGTDKTSVYKENIISAMDEINSLKTEGLNINYGALIYRGLEEAQANRITEHISLTSQYEKVAQFVKEAEFKNLYHRDEYTAMLYGLQKALTVGEFEKDETNVIINLGINGDFSGHGTSRIAAEQNNRVELIKDTDKLIKNLHAIGVHLYSIQLSNEGFKSNELYQSQNIKLILGTGKYAYNSSYGGPDGIEVLSVLKNKGLSVSSPLMEQEEGKNRIPLVGASTQGALNIPLNNSFVSSDEIQQVMVHEVMNSINFVGVFRDLIIGLIDQGKEIDDIKDLAVGENNSFTMEGALAEWLYQVVKEDGIDVDNVLNEKLTLFTRVYFPHKYKDAEYPAVSYVLFMPDPDLRDYQQIIAQCAVDALTYDQKRQKLLEVYKNLVVQYTGSWNANKNISRSELFMQMQGVEKSGMQFTDSLDHKIPDITNRKKVSDAKVDRIIKRFYDIKENLAIILRKNKSYDFCYTSGNLDYYWLPIELLW